MYVLKLNLALGLAYTQCVRDNKPDSHDTQITKCSEQTTHQQNKGRHNKRRKEVGVERRGMVSLDQLGGLTLLKALESNAGGVADRKEAHQQSMLGAALAKPVCLWWAVCDFV